jgi:hypothetical protein
MDKLYNITPKKIKPYKNDNGELCLEYWGEALIFIKNKVEQVNIHIPCLPLYFNELTIDYGYKELKYCTDDVEINLKQFKDITNPIYFTISQK